MTPLIDLHEIDRRLTAAKVLVYDTETTGLSWKRDRTVGHVLTFSGDPRDSFYLPIRHGGAHPSGNLDPDKVHKMLRPHMARQNLKVVGHHLKFDMHFAANDDIVINGPLEDTLIDCFLANENVRSFALDACCREYGVQEKKGQELYEYLVARFDPKGNATSKQMAHFHKLAGDDPIAVDYATGDGTSTWQLMEKIQPYLDDIDDATETNLRRVWDVECRCIRALFRMERRGIRVDEEQLHRVHALVKRQHEIAVSKLPKDFNERAPTQLIKLFTDAGITSWPTTAPTKTKPNGQPSFPKWWLSTNPLGRSIVSAREFAHMDNSFITPLINKHLFDGRVHTNFNQTRGEEFGVVTGRLSSNDPNLQQVPKRNALLGALYRSAMIPDEGMVWGEEDYNQVEPRLLADYARVKILLEGYLSDPPIDAHSMVAQSAGIPRQSGKTLNQALLTGAGNKKAAAMLGLPMEQALKIVDQYFQVMPEIKHSGFEWGGRQVGFQRYAANIYRHRGYIVSWLGRRARIANMDLDYQALNRILQLGNADILKKSMADTDEYLASEGDVVHLLLNCHDAFSSQFRPEHRHIHDKALEIMQDYGPGKSVHFDVPFPLEADEGENWAEASYGVDTVREQFASVGAEYDMRKAA